jgi:hypothetical protein
MNTSLSKGALGGGPYSRGSNSARPGRKGLYGKNPVAKTRIDSGIRRLAAASRSEPASDPFLEATMLLLNESQSKTERG